MYSYIVCLGLRSSKFNAKYVTHIDVVHITGGAITKLFKYHFVLFFAHVNMNLNVFELSQYCHNLGAMNTSSGAKGKKRHVDLDDFTFDPTTMDPNDGKVPKQNATITPGQRRHKMEATIEADQTPSNHQAQGLPNVINLQSDNGLLRNQPPVSHRSNVQHEDMTLSVSTEGLNLIIRDCVKVQLFRKMKFFDKGKHGSYSTNTKTVCGLVMKFCNISSIQADHKWWDRMRPMVMRTHTDHRNNCIKAMRIKFRGKSPCCWCVLNHAQY